MQSEDPGNPLVTGCKHLLTKTDLVSVFASSRSITALVLPYQSTTKSTLYLLMLSTTSQSK